MDFYLSTGMSSSPDFDDAFHLGCRHDSYCYRQHSFSPTTILLRTTPTQGFKPFTVENDSRQNFPLSGFYNLLCPFPTLLPLPPFYLTLLWILPWMTISLKQHTSPAVVCKSSKYGIVKSGNCQSGSFSIALLVENTTVPSIFGSAVARLPELSMKINRR